MSTATTVNAAEREQEIIENLTKIRHTVNQLKGSNTVRSMPSVCVCVCAAIVTMIECV